MRAYGTVVLAGAVYLFSGFITSAAGDDCVSWCAEQIKNPSAFLDKYAPRTLNLEEASQRCMRECRIQQISGSGGGGSRVPSQAEMERFNERREEAQRQKALKDAKSIVEQLRSGTAGNPPATNTPGRFACKALPAGNEPSGEVLDKRWESMFFLHDIWNNRAPQGKQKYEIMLRLGELYVEQARYSATVGDSAAQGWCDQGEKMFRLVCGAESDSADKACSYLGEKGQ